MSKRQILSTLLAGPVVGLSLLAGCEGGETVRQDTKVRTRDDGTVIREEEKITRQDDGTTVKTETKKVERPDDD